MNEGGEVNRKHAQVELSNKKTYFVRPLNKNEYRDNRNFIDPKSRSSEITIGAEIDGVIRVIPSLWMTSEGIKKFSEQDAAKAAKAYMKENNVIFPKHEGFDYEKRSKAGGVASGPLAKNK